MASLSDETRRTLGLYLALWIGGEILGLLLVVGGALLHSNLVVRIGVFVIAAGMAGSLMGRLVAFRAAGRFRWSMVASVGLRAAAVLILLYAALIVHL